MKSLLAPAFRPDTICPPAGRNWYRTMTIDWTRKRRLPDVGVLALRGLAALAIAAALAADIYVLHYNWHHFALVERDGWIADYGRIKNLIETRYPNLDWTVTEARLDLYRLDLRATVRLRTPPKRGTRPRARCATSSARFTTVTWRSGRPTPSRRPIAVARSP